jgi:hypothetical protein
VVQIAAGEIIDPSKFYVQIMGKSTTDELAKLMNEMK